MGSRGRSIRLRIYFLVAVPLIMMLALAGVFAFTSITDYRNVTRAPNLILATAEQSTKFTLFLQAERRAALVYLSSPSSQTLAQYQAAVNATKAGAVQFDDAMDSPAVTSVEDAQETTAIGKMTGDVASMTQLRTGIEARKVQPLQAFDAYSLIIGDEPLIFSAEASSLTNSGAAVNGFGLIEVVQVREDVNQQDAILAGAFASGNLEPQLRAAFNQAAGRESDEKLLYPNLLSAPELADYNAPMSTPQSKTADAAITKVQQAIEAGQPLSAVEAQGMSGPAWQDLTTAWSNASYQGGLNAAQAVLSYDQGVANSARNRLIVIVAIGAAGVVITLIVTMLLARSVNRRLGKLRRTAVSLATEQLPGVIARLRRGEKVDLAGEVPPLRVGTDEIGQVGQAFDMVRQTALRSAVEESRLRTGINDMFRNLARRNQTLLQRQLTMLDGMERRATDPDVLDDLFKMDHLTTRMRRHAEGLIILSGAAPGRGWSTPVKLIDVMRGAVAEVEDFARVIVTTQSKAALSGAAVTDVIHLLAELIENATTLSPPFTQVRVHGEMVANGFAIEIEDRGLGMTPLRMGELNDRLGHPPDVNPSNTEQLGLFVVGQLARRHEIRVILRPSPYGGSTAVVMIPQRLVVDDSTPAIRAGSSGPHATPASNPASNPATGPASGPQMAAGAAAASGAAAAFGETSYPSPSFEPASPSFEPASYRPAESGPPPFVPPAYDFGSLTPPAAAAPPAAPAASAAPAPPAPPASSAAPGAPGAPPDLDNFPVSSPSFGAPSPVINGVPVTRPQVRPTLGGDAAPQYSSSSFYGTGTPFDSAGAPGPANGQSGSGVRSGSNGPNGSGGTGGPGGPPSGPGPNGSGAYGSPSYGPGPAYGPGSYGPGSYGAGNGYGNNGGAGGGYEAAAPASSVGAEDFKGLPRRVRQANLAPQLRASGDGGENGVPQASAPDPDDLKNTLSAMQRGWQQGRAQPPRDTGGTNGS